MIKNGNDRWGWWMKIIREDYDKGWEWQRLRVMEDKDEKGKKYDKGKIWF